MWSYQQHLTEQCFRRIEEEGQLLGSFPDYYRVDMAAIFCLANSIGYTTELLRSRQLLQAVNVAQIPANLRLTTDVNVSGSIKINATELANTSFYLGSVFSIRRRPDG